MMTSFPRLQSDNEPATAAPPQQHHGIKKGLYLIPSLFTAANIAMGFYAVMSALRGFQLVGNGAEMDLARETFDNAAKAIGWAMLFDMLDGRIARMTKTTTEIGVQLDSLADVLTFGIAPAVLAYAWGYGSALKEGTDAHQLGWFLSFMYLMCGAFRLARFNVQATRPRPLSEGTVKLDKHSFIGLPIPMSAALLASIVHFAPTPLMQYGPHLGQIYSGLLMALVACLSVLMVSTLRYSSFKQVGTGRGSTRLVILMVAAVGMLIWLYSRYVLLILVSIYVLHALLFRLGGIFRRSPDKEKP
jgi:CDP-diacylglycerol--serine O-phosphatidyltransferase